MNLFEQRLRRVDDFDSLLEYLRDELDWPVEQLDIEDLVYDYEPEELGIDPIQGERIVGLDKLDPPREDSSAESEASGREGARHG